MADEDAPERKADDDISRLIDAGDQIFALTTHPGYLLLLRQLEVEADDAKDKLVEMDPADIEGIKRAQDTVKRFRWWHDSVDAIVRAGHQEERIREENAGMVIADGGEEPEE